jgi:hypothetical protein
MEEIRQDKKNNVRTKGKKKYYGKQNVELMGLSFSMSSIFYIREKRFSVAFSNELRFFFLKFSVYTVFFDFRKRITQREKDLNKIYY